MELSSRCLHTLYLAQTSCSQLVLFLFHTWSQFNWAFLNFQSHHALSRPGTFCVKASSASQADPSPGQLSTHSISFHDWQVWCFFLGGTFWVQVAVNRLLFIFRSCYLPGMWTCNKKQQQEIFQNKEMSLFHEYGGDVFVEMSWLPLVQSQTE